MCPDSQKKIIDWKTDGRALQILLTFAYLWHFVGNQNLLKHAELALLVRGFVAFGFSLSIVSSDAHQCYRSPRIILSSASNNPEWKNENMLNELTFITILVTSVLISKKLIGSRSTCFCDTSIINIFQVCPYFARTFLDADWIEDIWMYFRASARFHFLSVSSIVNLFLNNVLQGQPRCQPATYCHRYRPFSDALRSYGTHIGPQNLHGIDQICLRL